MANIHNVTFPFLVVHSRQDTMTDPDASAALFEKAQVSAAVHTLHKRLAWQRLDTSVLRACMHGKQTHGALAKCCS